MATKLASTVFNVSIVLRIFQFMARKNILEIIYSCVEGLQATSHSSTIGSNRVQLLNTGLVKVKQNHKFFVFWSCETTVLNEKPSRDGRRYVACHLEI